MFTIKWVKAAQTDYDALKRDAEASLSARKSKGKRKSGKAQGLFKQVHKTLTLLGQNPRHPGLQTHEYHSLQNPYDPKQKVFEAYAQQNTPCALGVFWYYGPHKQEITILAITPHP